MSIISEALHELKASAFKSEARKKKVNEDWSDWEGSYTELIGRPITCPTAGGKIASIDYAKRYLVIEQPDGRRSTFMIAPQFMHLYSSPDPLVQDFIDDLKQQHIRQQAEAEELKAREEQERIERAARRPEKLASLAPMLQQWGAEDYEQGYDKWRKYIKDGMIPKDLRHRDYRDDEYRIYVTDLLYQPALRQAYLQGWDEGKRKKAHNRIASNIDTRVQGAADCIEAGFNQAISNPGMPVHYTYDNFIDDLDRYTTNITINPPRGKDVSLESFYALLDALKGLDIDVSSVEDNLSDILAVAQNSETNGWGRTAIISISTAAEDNPNFMKTLMNWKVPKHMRSGSSGVSMESAYRNGEINSEEVVLDLFQKHRDAFPNLGKHTYSGLYAPKKKGPTGGSGSGSNGGALGPLSFPI